MIIPLLKTKTNNEDECFIQYPLGDEKKLRITMIVTVGEQLGDIRTVEAPW